ncbi:MAG: EAL domain-containing protein [Burkholderiaceae bacterium]|nr:EAL domain-containing protein [Rhodoferax sp.]MCP5286655.1 EAL domain-containing protein [Burkholderiaceae bacterium]
MRLPHLSLRGAVLAAIVAGVLLPAGLVIFIGDFAARQSQQPVIDRTRGAVVALATAALTEPAWTLSTPGLQAAIANILREPSVCGVEVLDLQPTIDAPEFRRLQCATTPPAALREAPVRYEGQTIARVRVHFDDSELDRLLLERRLSTLWLVALQVLAGGLVIAGLMSSRLVRPIEALKRQADSLTHRQPGPLPDWSADDELGQLGRHLTSVHTQVRQLIDELEHKNEALRQMALHDALTGLPNRTLLRELFTVAAAQARRDGGRLVLMFVDLDHFKAVNDTHGHAAGDALLQVVARRLRQCLREADVVCRMAGDEFLVLMPDCDDAAAELAAVRIINHLREPQPLPGVAEALRIGSSIGIARFPDDAPDFDALVHAADVAMYRSKQLGRARHGFYHADMDTELRARRTLERELADAIDTGQLRLHYQPLVDPHDGRILGAEALVRWAHPTRGLLAADAFIEAAEACGLVVPLGQWVLETACAQLAAWRAAGKPPLQVAINVSALQLRDEDFPARVADAVQRHGLPHHALELELTEVTLLADGDATQRAVAALRAAGVRLAVDDFGCGYSSLATLKMLQPDRMKIDRSFVRDLPQSRGDGELVQAMFGMARALDVEVVAEGVETGAHRAWLLGCGPHLQQGWLWARALPADEFAALLPALPVPVS